MKIKINNLEWKIEEVETRSSELMVDGNQCFGVCKFHSQEIFLDATLKSDKLCSTLRHELTHAFLYCYMLESKKTYTEEEVCEFVALYSKQINDIVLDYIKEHLK